MASANIYTIASSTPLATANMSSSPLPSPSHIFESTLASRLRTGCSALPIPAGAASTFTSASSLLREGTPGSLQCLNAFEEVPTNVGIHLVDLPTPPKTVETRNTATTKDDNQEVRKVAKAPRKSTKQSTKDGTTETAQKKPRKPRAEKVSELDSDTVKERAPRKSSTKKASADADINVVPKEKPARKQRTKKAENSKDSQSKISKGQVTKTTSLSNPCKDKPQGDDTVSKHFSNRLEAVKPVLESPEPQEYGLMEASRRKLNWTPPKPTPVGTDNSKSPEVMDLFDTSSKGFTDMLGNFSFSSNDTKDVEKASDGLTTTRKRKLIEMFKTNIPTNAKIPKEKAVRKKARTITELAISAYGPAEAQDGELPDAPAPLLKYLATGTDDGEAATSLCKAPPKPRSQSPEKAKAKSKKGTAAEPILLSPESALKQVSGQDFVFGTSSQLAREESPTLLRDLHLAMQASNELNDYDDPFVSPPSMVVSRSKAVVTANRNLWSVAARDDRGDLMDVEVVDLVDTPVIKSKNRIMQTQSPVIHTPLNNNDEWVDIDDIEANRPPSTQVEFRQIPPVAISMRSRFSSSPPRFQNSPQKVINTSPRNFSTSSTSLAKSRKKPRASPETAEPSMPDYNLLSTPELKTEISKHKFKPVRNRKKMIELLEECWEGSNRPALGILQGNLPIPKSQASTGLATASNEGIIPSPKRGPGRPKKDAVITATSPTSKARGRLKKVKTVEHLEMNSDTPLPRGRTPKRSKKAGQLVEDASEMDSDTPLPRVRTPKKSKKAGKSVEDASDSDHVRTPSPRRRTASRKRRKATSLPLSPSVDREDEDELTLSGKREQLFGVISTAVTSAPPSKDPSKPSWHEKILLYDPIVLEDLTIWLNTGALDKVGWDEEVAPFEVKKWCESKSICCLWKENLRGKARSR